MTFALKYKGFDYVAFFDGAYEDSDSLPSLVQTGANAIEATLDYGIDAATSQVVADPNYTDSLAALGNTIAQAESLGLSVMVRPLIDFLDPAESAPYSVGEWRQDYQPTNVAAFFASYQQMIVAEARVAQANGAQTVSIGAELDQLAGPQYLSYWTGIISAVRQVFTGALTYSASWNTANEVSFWSQLNFEGIDCYVPLSNAPNPSLQDLVDGWIEPATEATNPDAYAVIGNQSPIQYFESLSAKSGLPLLFTELGYANDSGAAADPSASGNDPDPALQAELYQAFFKAWQQSGSSSLIGTYFWEWDPNGSTANVGPGVDSFSPQNSPAQNQATIGFLTPQLDAPSDFNGDGISDIFWQNGTSGAVGEWLMDPSGSGQITSAPGIGNATGYTIVGIGDFTGNGTSDVLTRQGNGALGDWLISDGQISAAPGLGTITATTNIAAIGDFTGNGIDDIFWQDSTTGEIGEWLMDSGGSGLITAAPALGLQPASLRILGAGDFTGNDTDDIFWEEADGTVGEWLMTHGQINSGITLGGTPAGLQILGFGDFKGNGTDDVLWRSGNTVGEWMMQNGQIDQSITLGTVAGTWQFVGTGDFTGNGTDGILWRDGGSGALVEWQMSVGQISQAPGLGTVAANVKMVLHT